MRHPQYLSRVLVLLALLAFASTYHAQNRDPRSGVTPTGGNDKRIALVIGNSSYAAAQLKSPVNDASNLARLLRSLAFEVMYRENLDQDGMQRSIRDFGVLSRGAKVSLFYFAGHGIQVKGINYLVPVNATLENEDDVDHEAVNARLVLAEMEGAKSEVNIVILDACRSNPFGQSFRARANGLAQMQVPARTLIAYSTSPGSVATDEGDQNGIYAQQLMKVMRTPNLSIEEAFKRLSISVQTLTNNKQTPWEISSLLEKFSFWKLEPEDWSDSTSGGGVGSGSGGGMGSGSGNSAIATQPVQAIPEKESAVSQNERVFSTKEVDEPVQILAKPKAGYTEQGRQNQIQGTVRIRLVLAGDGTVKNIYPITTLPYGLTEKAVEAARHIKFRPAVKKGSPVSVSVIVEYGFALY